MRQRDYYFDNVKFILIVFVVFGHFLRSFIEHNDVIYALYKVIYSFHMPAFILVSGFFAKGFFDKGYVAKLAKKLILPYIIFQLIYSVFYFYLYDKSTLKIDPFNPHWSLWFLISLFFWNIMLFVFAKMKPSVAIALAIFIGLAVGYVDWISNYMSLSRTFVFFPLFLIGYFMKKEHLVVLSSTRIRILASMSFVAIFLWFYLNPDIPYQWLLGSKSYEKLGTYSVLAMFKRLGFYSISFWMILSFFAFVPNKKYFFTNLGKNTLYVYLLHGFFVRLFRESSIQSYFDNPERCIYLAAIALVLTLLLSSKMITSFAQPLIEFRLSKLRKLKYEVLTSVKSS
ncbi:MULTISPECIES: acyltransferase family protein [unclassified Bacillus (in: firmicutes)]|uniref:acyltransferase family protein n=1 Tax=unclassified Bacillus (in: firmicutes) TaxID=185979 RepID=UPI0008E0CD59|nr:MULTISPECIES: acyltransferase family protein [unclassified Bacillus (in: firmicutes)]SFA77363.1 Fucose 4-O-acetylase [Bacillus sp. UNCCL13]SFQ67316.1 Fucose 4-O-acetylase [Bacillus sp. cl95]